LIFLLFFISKTLTSLVKLLHYRCGEIIVFSILKNVAGERSVVNASRDQREFKTSLFHRYHEGSALLYSLRLTYNAVEVVYVGGEAIMRNETMQSLIHGRAILRPQADPEKCTSCGPCVDHCPVSALSMVGNIPRVNADICIACFCCQEMCPEKAVMLR